MNRIFSTFDNKLPNPMKKKIFFILACSFVIFLFQPESQAQTKKLIHYWHFNNTVAQCNLGAIPADYSTLGNASIIYKPVKVAGATDTTHAYIDNYKRLPVYDTINQGHGFGGCCGATNYAVRTRNPSDYMQFLVHSAVPASRQERMPP